MLPRNHPDRIRRADMNSWVARVCACNLCPYRNQSRWSTLARIRSSRPTRRPGHLARIHRRYGVTAAEWAMRGKGRRWSGHDFG